MNCCIDGKDTANEVLAQQPAMFDTRSMRILSLVIGWTGGLYGTVRGCLFAFQPFYTHVSSNAPQPTLFSGDIPAGSAVSNPPPFPEYADPVLALVIIAIALITFGGVLTLLTLGKSEVFSIYAFTLFVLCLLSLPGTGWIFLPATTLLLLAAVVAWILQRGANVASLLRRN